MGFAINRAALYSTLTVAAVAIFAGVNWLAQHIITARLALVLQPVAAIVIGLGFLRAREWTQTLLERTFFRERFAAEQRLDATIPADVLSLQSAAVVREDGELDEALLRRLCEAAAVAYQLAEMRAELARLRERRDLVSG